MAFQKTRGDAYGHTPDTDRRRSRVLSTSAQDTHNMAVDYALSAKAPPLQINLDADMMHGLARYCERYGRRPMTQAGLTWMQAIPIVNAPLAVKESEKQQPGTWRCPSATKISRLQDG